MINIKKIGNKVSPDIEISNGITSFMIARNNLPDLCWYPEINCFTNYDDITFVIKEEDGDIYLLFDKLYQDIINGNVFPLKKEDIKNKSLEDIKKLKLENKKERAEFRKKAKESGLISDGVISWHSEDYDSYDYASILTIKNVDKQIEIIFSKNKRNFEEGFTIFYPTYNVRITESGGRYWPFFMIFVNFLRQLQELDLQETSSLTDSVSEEESKVLLKTP